MTRRESTQNWQIARLEFAFFDARFDRWILHQKFDGAHVSELSSAEAAHRAHIQQLLASARICLQAALDNGLPNETNQMIFGPDGGNPDFYFCPCVLALDRSRPLRAVKNHWGTILDYYQEVLQDSGLGEKQAKPIRGFLREARDTQEAVVQRCPISESGGSPPTGAVCPRHNSKTKNCSKSLSFKDALQLVSILPIQRTWDLFGYWATTPSEDGFWSARLRFPKSSSKWPEPRSCQVLGYEVQVQLLPNNVKKDRDFFEALNFVLEDDKELSSYRAYAAFIDQLQQRLTPQVEETSATEYIIAYPIIVHGTTHLFQVRLTTSGAPDVSKLHSFWKRSIHGPLVSQRFTEWISKMLEHVVVESFQFHLTQSLPISEPIPVFSRKTLASTFCEHLNQLIPAKEAFIPESEELWRYSDDRFGRKWRRGSEKSPFMGDIGLSESDYGVEIKLDPSNPLCKTGPGKEYLAFLLQQQWRWFERFTFESAASRSGFSIRQGRKVNLRLEVARMALIAVGREMDRQDREKNTSITARLELANRLDGMVAQFKRSGPNSKHDISLLFQEKLPAVAPWKGEEQWWSLADMFGLPPGLKQTRTVPVDVLETAIKALRTNWRELMAHRPNGTGLLNHFGKWLEDRVNQQQPLDDVQEVVELVGQLDWNTKAGSSVKTVKESVWFTELCSQLSNSRDFGKLDRLQGDWDEELSKSILAIGTQSSSWAAAPALVDAVGQQRGKTPMPDLRHGICQPTGIAMSDIHLIHTFAESNSKHSGEITWVGWRTDNHPIKYLRRVELAWRFAKCNEKDLGALSLLEAKIRAQVESINDKNEMTLGPNGDHIEDIVRVVCYRYNGVFYLSTGTHYLTISCQNGSAKVDPFLPLPHPEQAAYYCVLQ